MGGITDMALEYVTLNYVSQAAIPVGKVNLNAGDAVGVGSAVGEIAFGIIKRKYRVVLFGAGGLAVALATIVGKTMIAYTPAPTLAVSAMAQNMRTSFSVVTPPASAAKGSYR